MVWVFRRRILPASSIMVSQLGKMTKVSASTAARAVRELGGSLGVHSDGHELDATFTLELPVDCGKARLT